MSLSDLLNGLFLQSSDVSVDGSVETFATGISRFAALVDGEHAYSLADLRSVVVRRRRQQMPA